MVGVVGVEPTMSETDSSFTDCRNKPQSCLTPRKKASILTGFFIV